MASYGWYLRSLENGKLVVIVANQHLASVSFTDALLDATQFDRFTEARDIGRWLCEQYLVVAPLEVIDYAIPDAPIPDADQTPVPSFEAVLAAVQERNAAERDAAKHDSRDAVLSLMPPIGELARDAASQKPQGYGMGGFGRPQW